METKWAKVFVIDDYPSVAGYLRFLIDRQKDFQVCGDAPNARQALEMLPSCNPDLILLDLILPDRHGLEVIKDIRVVDPNVRILVFSVHDEVVFAARAIEAGSQGYVMKSETCDTWFEAMRQVMAGYIYLSPAMRMRVTQQWANNKRHSDVCGINQLSDREIEVLQLLGEGRSVSQICAMLSLGRHTIQTYESRIKDKLGLTSAQELTRYAVLWAVDEGSHYGEGIRSDSMASTSVATHPV